MEFRILGSLEVVADGREVPLGGARQRAVLAILLLHRGEVVPVDRIAEELWGERPPETAIKTVQVYVSRLRKVLPQDALGTRSPGYVLGVAPDELDLDRFERLVDEGRSLLARGQPADASERLRDALSLWRGPALADFAYESFAQAAIARLEEIRLAAVELRIDADLALGRHDELVGELEALVAEEPLRERLRRHLMTALYRSGRQAEALDAYKDARRALVDELGIEPSAALQELERAILRQEPALNLPATVSASVGEAAERSILVAITNEARVDALLAVAEPLVRDPPRVMVLARLVSDAAELRLASAWLEERRSALEASGVAARAASFTSTAPGEELARLASELDVDLLLADAPDELLVEGAPDERHTAVLAEAPCDVALLAPRDETPEGGPVLVPFGGAEHDWAAVELGAWFARAEDAPLRLAGAAAVPERGRRDASRLLSHGALAVQRVLGISAEPLLVPAGEEGMLEASRDAGLLVVGLSTRWHREGLGPARLRLAREASPPTLLVCRGLRPGGLAPPPALTRFTWSIRP
ncbi:MAG TPA: AfsR/SARP family transcriptional regulator [Solirubrobacterales bacterium]|jgi:DNA-binding SARP family transcriptional activator|nr:AfsR/SARP family transcriptional regulator [Solirubrobacterales bacterium]